ncbi:Citrate lyase subunit beta-like protein, mitochondrial [Myotis brandtii]|uniref:Citrate lyase subunit beta-like protein, mitochondrial n=1 Tax=Myotis brandtii TaxID=109478 RepID=S7MD07_MYOBR|nr:Citrate lyase subunit beta-like protein, mitochondrial [Myotis brandtii]
MFPDDRFWNLGYPTGSAELAVNWSHGKNWRALVFKELNFLFKVFLGATSSKETQDILYARQKIIVVAKAFGLQAIDLVYIDFRDEEGLLRQAREGATMGFTGKQVIHPNQIAAVQEQFSPSPEKIKWAEELIAAFEEHQQLGKVPKRYYVMLYLSGVSFPDPPSPNCSFVPPLVPA